jgi:hypothetical protein
MASNRLLGMGFKLRLTSLPFNTMALMPSSLGLANNGNDSLDTSSTVAARSGLNVDIILP